jgi:hypothetical protein
MKKILTILPLALLANCVTLLPVNEREKTWVEEKTNTNATTAYERASAQIARSASNNYQILLQDKDAKRIILAYKLVGCAAPGYLATEMSPSWHEFKLEIETKDNRARILVLDIQSWPETGNGRGPNVFGPRDKEQLDGTIEKCIKPMVIQPLISAIRGESKGGNW